MADIFISYSREDIARVQPLVDALQLEGFSVWWDGNLTPGERFEETIDREIQAAACVLVVWSRSSVESQWVKNEALEGMDREVLVPVMLDQVRLPVAFKQHQVASFTSWPESVDTNQYQRVIDALSGLVGGEVREDRAVRGIQKMAPRGRKRFRRKRDLVVPTLLFLIVALSLGLMFGTRLEPTPVPALTRLAVDRFVSAGGEQSDFVADSMTREIQLRLDADRQIELVQIGSPWDLNVFSVPENVTRTEADYILKGRVNAGQTSVELFVELSESEGGKVLWTDHLNDELTNIIDLQQYIVDSVLKKMNRGALRQLEVATTQPMTKDKQAYRDYLIGQDLMRRGEEQNLREAIGRFQAAAQKDPQFNLARAASCRAFLELFRATQAAEDFVSGKQNCELVLDLPRAGNEIHLALAELYRASGDLASASHYYLKTLEAEPNSPDAMIGLADVLVSQGKAARGEAMYIQSTRLNPTYWKVHNSLGTYYFRQGMFNRAIESYLRVTELTTINAVAFNNLGAARFYAGDFKGASEAWGRANELETNSASFSNLGTAFFHAGKFEEALVQYEAALAIDPDDHRLWGNVGDDLRFIPGRHAEALRFYQEAIKRANAVIEVNPDDAYTLSRLAVYHAAIGDNAIAVTFAGRAELLAGFDLNVLYDLAVVSVLLEDSAKAQEYVSRALNAGYPSVLVKSDPQLIGNGAALK